MGPGNLHLFLRPHVAQLWVSATTATWVGWTLGPSATGWGQRPAAAWGPSAGRKDRPSSLRTGPALESRPRPTRKGPRGHPPHPGLPLPAPGLQARCGLNRTPSPAARPGSPQVRTETLTYRGVGGRPHGPPGPPAQASCLTGPARERTDLPVRESRAEGARGPGPPGRVREAQQAPVAATARCPPCSPWGAARACPAPDALLAGEGNEGPFCHREN